VILILLAYKVSQFDYEYANFDPYEILGVPLVSNELAVVLSSFMQRAESLQCVHSCLGYLAGLVVFSDKRSNNHFFCYNGCAIHVGIYRSICDTIISVCNKTKVVRITQNFEEAHAVFQRRALKYYPTASL